MCKDILVVCDYSYSYTYYYPGGEYPKFVHSLYAQKDECEALFEDLMFDLYQYDPLFGTNHEDLPCYPLEEIKTSNDKVVYWRKRYLDRKQAYDKTVRELALKKYWSEHAEEKKALDNRLSEIEQLLQPLIEQSDTLNKQKKALKKALNKKMNGDVPAEKDIRALSSKVNALKQEFDSLWFFAGKRKKEIQAELDSLNTEIEKLRKLSADQRTQMQKEIQDEIKKIDEQLAPINAQIETLKSEKKLLKNLLKTDNFVIYFALNLLTY